MGAELAVILGETIKVSSRWAGINRNARKTASAVTTRAAKSSRSLLRGEPLTAGPDDLRDDCFQPCSGPADCSEPGFVGRLPRQPPLFC